MDFVQPCPSYFRTLIFQSSHNCINDIQKCWDYLCSPNTFKGSFWNFSKVEFVNPKNPSDLFSEGAYTNHHGPLLSANGIISKIEKPFYRKMDYFYGSYIGTFRLFRPVELIFTFKKVEQATLVETKITFFVHQKIPKWIAKIMNGVWQSMMKSLMIPVRQK